MSKRYNETKAALEIAAESREYEFRRSYSSVATKFNSMSLAALSQSQQLAVDDIRQQISKTKESFDTENPVQAAKTQAGIKQFKTRQGIRRGAELLLLFVCLFVLPSNWIVSLAIFIATLIVRNILKKKEKSAAQQLARESHRPLNKARNILGGAETPNSSASGLYQRLDDIYLASLSSTDRILEMQRRATERQNLLAQRQHQESMDLMRHSINVQRQMRDEQSIQTDILTGRYK